jgi:hypothetical protein
MKTDEMSRQRRGVSRRSVSCGAHLPHIEQSVERVMGLVHVKERCVEVGGQLGRTMNIASMLSLHRAVPARQSGIRATHSRVWARGLEGAYRWQRKRQRPSRKARLTRFV